MSNIILQNKNKLTCSKLTNFQDMIDARIITKNLVYIIGLSPKIANRDLLLKYEYLAQFGKIIKIVVNKNKAYNSNNPKGPSYSAYVTFSKPSEASIAILSLDSCVVDDHMVRASFGTTKYCTFYLKHQECPNRDCLFLHCVAEESDIISREDLNYNKNIFVDQQIYAMKIADIFNIEVKKKIISGINKKIKSVFPSPEALYSKDIVKKNDHQIINSTLNIPNNFNHINNNVNNQSFVPKKKYYEEDNYQKNKKGNGTKFEYIEKVITSNSDIFGSYLKNNEEIEKTKLDVSYGKINNHENDTNHETTSTSSKDENFCKPVENFERKEKNLNEYIDVLKYQSEKSQNFKTNNEKKIFICRENSRFDFVKNKNNHINCYENIIIPDFILDLINKKTSRYKLTKKIDFSEDILYKDSNLEKEYNESNLWAQFIIENKKIDRESELIHDFDKINESLIDKFTTFYLK